jgi:chemotaxis protein histidine kinase CheA
MEPASSEVLTRRRLTVETTLLVLTFVSTTVGGAISFVWNNTIENGQREHSRQLADQTQYLAELKEANSYTLSVHKEVVEALKSENKRHEAVAIALVESLPTNSPYRERLLIALSKGAITEEIRERAFFETEESKADAESEQAQKEKAPPAETPKWAIDVFYCESAAENRSQAELLAKELEQKPISSSMLAGRIRTRLLPQSVNMLPGYRVSGIQVRYEYREKAAATELANFAQESLKQEVSAVQISKHTPSYLSVFFCAGSSPASGGTARDTR